MNKWYISIQNKARGPFTDLQMQKKIEEGEVEGLTLTYKEGDTDWLPLEKQEIWLSSKKKTENSPSEPINTDWILLVENPEKEGQFLQKGPYSDSKVRELIKNNEVQLKDYCWKPGMSDWKLLFETVELGLSRKPKVEFAKPKNLAFEEEETKDLTQELNFKLLKAQEKEDTQGELDLEPLPQLELNLKKSENTEEDFVAPYQEEIKPLDAQAYVAESVVLEKLSKEPEDLITVKEEDLKNIKKEKKSFFFSRIFLSFLVIGVFGGGIFQGYKNSSSLINSNIFEKGSLISGLSDFKKLFIKADVPKASYVMIKQLEANPKNILVRSDAKGGVKVEISVKDLNKKLIKLKGGLDKAFVVKTNTFGEAFINMSSFSIEEGKPYIVSAKIGKLRADKKYLFSLTKNDVLNKTKNKE